MPSTRPTVDPVLDILEEMGYDFDELDGDGYKRSLKEAIIKLTNSTTGTGTGDGFEFGMNANEQIEFVNKENTDMFFATNNAERLRI